jgi:hypothetical protein
LNECTKSGANGGQKNEIQVISWRKFKRCVSKAIKNDVFSKVLTNGEVDIADEIQNSLTANQVMVIDIARLDENTQSFVFGSVARAIYDMKLGADRDNIPDKVILFVDELNKYASNDIPKNSPILRQLLEITERGRSLGIILFGVEPCKRQLRNTGIRTDKRNRSFKTRLPLYPENLCKYDDTACTGRIHYFQSRVTLDCQYQISTPNI